MPRGTPEAPEPYGATKGPDGTFITSDAFPTQVTRRPLVLPLGAFAAYASVGVAAEPGATPGIGLSASYGLAGGFDATLTGAFVRSTGVSGQVYRELTGNIALAIVGAYFFDHGEPSHPEMLLGGFGLPVKFAWARSLFSIRALDTVFTYQSFSFRGGLNLSQAAALLPLRIDFSPLSWMSFHASNVAAIVFPTGENLGPPVGNLSTELGATLTLRHFDLGAWTSFTVAAQRNGTSAGFAGGAYVGTHL